MFTWQKAYAEPEQRAQAFTEYDHLRRSYCRPGQTIEML
jgi:hypothetical protein